ncbi:MAG: hypothetical protein FLDDKLPJ_03290 [Phycisphaerae bacterium]|nr:hypothetical protein [Phycisphaerae bacterium]
MHKHESDHSDGNNDAWCRAGNSIDDGQMRYTYDAWNRLVKVTRKQDTDIVIQTAEYDGLGRRTQKVVTKSGELDGTFVCSYADTRAAGFSPREFSGGGGLAGIGGASPGGWSIVEIRDGSNNVYQQVYHGTQYIDEIVAMRLEHGYAVVYQDANWNTIATCDLAGRVLERIFTTPYGSPIIEPETFFGDYDGDGDVDSTDDASLGSGQTCWGTPSGTCRVFDFNQDGTLDSADETVMTALVSAASTNRRHENRTVSPTGMAFLHQALQYDLEIHAIQNRARQYLSKSGRFSQRDPIGYVDGTNFYVYARNSPQNLRDPNGLGQVCVDSSCSAAPPGNVIPELQPPPLVPMPAPGTCVAVDGLILNGKMHKVSDGCTITVSCTANGPVATCSFFCSLFGGCHVCNNPGQTICHCRCLKWEYFGTGGCFMGATVCTGGWKCKPDSPFVFPGQFDKCDPSNCNQYCTNYGCSPF